MPTPAPQQAPGTNQEQIDPTALNLARAIRTVESGDNPTAKGASGEFGIGQWMPGNFESAAHSYGLDPNDKSQANQEHVLYKQVEEQLKAGHSQSEVASWWNSGKYDPTGNVGVNKEGVAYNTPAYVEKVKQEYLKASQGQTTAPQQQSGGFVNPQQQPQTSNFVQPPAPVTPPLDQNAQSEGNFLQKAAGVAGGLFHSAADPLVSLAAKPVQGLAGLLGQPDPYAQGVPTPFGTAKVSAATPEAAIGDAAQVGSYFVPGSGVLSAAGMGALQGAGSAMSQGGDIAQVATGLGEGALVGGVTAGATKAVGSVVSKLGDMISGETATKATNGIKNAYASVLNLSAGERAVENRSGKDLAQVLVDAQAPLGRYEDGTLDASKAIPVLQDKLKPLDAEAEAILGGTRSKVNLFDAANAAKSTIGSKNLPALDRNAIAANVDKYIQAEVTDRATRIAQETYSLPLDKLTTQQRAKVLYDAANPHVVEADKIKSALWNSVGKGFDRDTQLGENATYQLGHSLKNAIESAVPENARIGDVNKERGALIDAVRRLTKMDGVKRLKGEQLGNIASGAMGAIAGAVSGLGPLGVLGGDYFGQKAGQFLQNPATKIATATYKAKAAGSMGSLLGKASVPVGKAINKAGGAISNSARAAGLMGNLLTK